MDLESNERKLVNISSHLYWSGFQGKGRFELYKYIFKSLNLEKYCNDIEVIRYFQDVDKNTSFFKEYKEDTDFCNYACNYITKWVKDEKMLKITK